MDTHTATTEVVVETPACLRCGEKSLVTVKYGDYVRWTEGAHVQNVWPDMAPPQRELLITGTHPECWDAMFGSLEDVA